MQNTNGGELWSDFIVIFCMSRISYTKDVLLL